MAFNPSFGSDLMKYGLLGQDPIPSGDYYLSLHTSEPNWSGSGEVSGGSYQRQKVTLGADGTSITNTQPVEFEGMPATGAITHVGLWDAQTGGRLAVVATVSSPSTVPAGATVRFKANTYTVSLGS